MCGRYSLTQKLPAALGDQLDLPMTDLPERPRYNIAPTQMAPVILEEEGRRTIRPMQWGLIPFWAKDPAIGHKLINARGEGISKRPSFRTPFRRQRCLIPSDGFYEWKKTARGKQPFRFILTDTDVFCYAGLWDRWQRPDGTPLETFTIITTAANHLIQPMHDRMPVILPSDALEPWLDPTRQDAASLEGLLAPYPENGMRFYPVSPSVNSPKNDRPECIEPLDDQQSLL